VLLNKLFSALTALLLAAVFVLIVFACNNAILKPAISQAILSPTIIIDAGHGSPDGGTTGVNGVVEKDINLAIAVKTAELLKFGGYNVIMTRKDDQSLADSDLHTIRKKKVDDMNKRLGIINSTPNSIFVSIHQNYYEGYSQGAQMFHGKKNESSKILAQTMQDTFKELIQPENHRKIKSSDRSLYLLENAESTAVMIECGFLSDYTESRLLATNEYQSKIAFCIYASITDFVTQNQM